MTTIPVGLSTSSVFPAPVETAFELAARLGYDGVEVMVTAERASQDPEALADLIARYRMRVLAIHSPCLVFTARVWGTDPVGKIERSVEMAEHLGAQVVVAHPPLLGQPMTAESFPDAVRELSAGTDVHIAVENMFPLPVPIPHRMPAAFSRRVTAPLLERRVRASRLSAYRPHWNPVETGYPAYALDLSHAESAGIDARELAARMGDRLVHVHLTDGSGSQRDEHLLPGRGRAPCAEVLAGLAAGEFGAERPSVVLEVSTSGRSAADRTADLAEALAFARQHLG